MASASSHGSNAAFEKFFDLSLDLLCIASTTGFFKILNPQWTKALGWTERELTAVPFIEFVHPEDVSATLKAVERLSYQETVIDFTNRYRCKDRIYKWIRWSSVAAENGDIYAVARDITKEVWQNQLMNELQKTAKIGAWDIKLDTMKCQWSDEIYRIMELPADKEINLADVIAMFAAEDQTRVQSAIEESIRLGKPFSCEARLVSGKGRDFWVKVMGRPIVNEGECSRMTGVFQDITELKNTDRLKQEFVSIVSHELRTPITAMLGSLRLLQSGVVSQDSEKEHLLNVAVSNTHRLTRIINDILDVEKMELGRVDFHFDKTDLREVVESNSLANTAHVQGSGRLRCEVPDFPIMVDCDVDRIHQILNNLISNASRFTPPPEADVWVKLSLEKGSAVLRIIDRGPGIPKANRHLAFQKFSQFHEMVNTKHPGTGLGLAICKEVVERHRGNISFADNDDGPGLTFFVKLPLLQP